MGPMSSPNLQKRRPVHLSTSISSLEVYQSIYHLTFKALNSFVHGRIDYCNSLYCANQKNGLSLSSNIHCARGEILFRIGLTKKIGLELVPKRTEGSCQPDIIQDAIP